MILGTTNACPSCSGACASTFSRGRLGRTSSSRRGMRSRTSPAKASGSTEETSTACSRSMYSSTWPSCAANRSSSSADSASRARRATCLTCARSIATWGLLGLVGGLEPVEDGVDHVVLLAVAVEKVPGAAVEERPATGGAVEQPDAAGLLGHHQCSTARAAPGVQLPQRFLLALLQA